MIASLLFTTLWSVTALAPLTSGASAIPMGISADHTIVVGQADDSVGPNAVAWVNGGTPTVLDTNDWAVAVAKVGGDTIYLIQNDTTIKVKSTATGLITLATGTNVTCHMNSSGLVGFSWIDSSSVLQSRTWDPVNGTQTLGFGVPANFRINCVDESGILGGKVGTWTVGIPATWDGTITTVYSRLKGTESPTDGMMLRALGGQRMSTYLYASNPNNYYVYEQGIHADFLSYTTGRFWPGTPHMHAYDLNSNLISVGWYGVTSMKYAVYATDVNFNLHDFDTSLDTGSSGWHIKEARAISPDNYVVGVGNSGSGADQAVLLTPQ